MRKETVSPELQGKAGWQMKNLSKEKQVELESKWGMSHGGRHVRLQSIGCDVSNAAKTTSSCWGSHIKNSEMKTITL